MTQKNLGLDYHPLMRRPIITTNMTLFSILFFTISTAALLASLVSLRALNQAGMLNKDFLTKNGFKNTFAYLLWILLWVGSIALFFKQTWGITTTQVGLVMFLIYVVLLGIGRIVGFIRLSNAKPTRELDDEGNVEIIDPSGYIDEEFKAYIWKGILVSLGMMILISGLVVWSLNFLQQAR